MDFIPIDRFFKLKDEIPCLETCEDLLDSRYLGFLLHSRGLKQGSQLTVSDARVSFPRYCQLHSAATEFADIEFDSDIGSDVDMTGVIEILEGALPDHVEDPADIEAARTFAAMFGDEPVQETSARKSPRQPAPRVPVTGTVNFAQQKEGESIRAFIDRRYTPTFRAKEAISLIQKLDEYIDLWSDSLINQPDDWVTDGGINACIYGRSCKLEEMVDELSQEVGKYTEPQKRGVLIDGSSASFDLRREIKDLYYRVGLRFETLLQDIARKYCEVTGSPSSEFLQLVNRGVQARKGS